MNFLDFKNKIEEFPLFKTKDLKLILDNNVDRSFLNNLKNWENKGYLIQLRKGVYLLGELKAKIEPLFLASKLYPPSYVSLETALSYYGIIPEAVFTTTSITTRKTKEFTSKNFGKFTYQTIKKSAFGGFETHQENNISFNLALPEKALVDFFYINKNILNGDKTQFESYRFEEEFSYNKKKLLKFAEAFENTKVLFLTNQFIKFYASR